MTMFVSSLSFILPYWGGVHAHSRWSCPEARSSDTGIKVGPCGDGTNDYDDPLLLIADDDDSILEISPGPMRVTFVESIHHTGAPFRISLSGEF